MRVWKAIGLSLLITAATSCGAGGGDSSTDPNPDPGPSTSSAIDVRDDFFTPQATTVPVGTTITWTWRGNNFHDVVFSSSTDHSDVKSSGTYSRQFTVAGTYTYMCSIHGSAMTGQIVVQ
jgi:plastocyanin